MVSTCAPSPARRPAVASLAVTRETVTPRRAANPLDCNRATSPGSERASSIVRAPEGSAIGAPFSSASSMVSVATTTPSPIAAAPSNAPAMPAFTTKRYGRCASAAAMALAASTGPTPVISTVTSSRGRQKASSASTAHASRITARR